MPEPRADHLLRQLGEVPGPTHGDIPGSFEQLRNLHRDDACLRAEAEDRWGVPDPNKAGDLETLRERALLRACEQYRESSSRRLNVFRLEAVRAGLRPAWAERACATLVAVAPKTREDILHEAPWLFMWYDQALTRMGEEV